MAAVAVNLGIPLRHVDMPRQMPRTCVRLREELRGQGRNGTVFVYSEHHGARNPGREHRHVLGAGREAEGS